MTDSPHAHDRLDEATSRRLARLGKRPVDTARLEARLAEAMSAESPRTVQAHRPVRRWLAPAAGMAAAALIALSLIVAFQAGTPRAVAAPVELARLHHDLIEGRLAVQPVSTLDEANAWIARQAADTPALPDTAPGARVQSCCLANVTGRLVAVALLDDGGDTVTLVVAEARDFAMQMGTPHVRNGREMFSHEVNGVPMMMANVGDRWLCVMGDLPEDRLADIAGGVRF